MAKPPTLQELEGLWRTEDRERDLDFRPDGVLLIKGIPFGWALVGDILMVRSVDQGIQRFGIDLSRRGLRLEDSKGIRTFYLWQNRPKEKSPIRPKTASSAAFPYQLRAASGFQKASQHGGVIRLESPRSTGVVLLVPGQGILTPQKLTEASRSGWNDPTTHLQPDRPGSLVKIPVGDGGEGGYFGVRGKLAGNQVRGVVAGVFGPGGTSPYLVFATAPAVDWRRFEPLAQGMVESIRYQGKASSVTAHPTGPQRVAVSMAFPRKFRQDSGEKGTILLSSDEAQGTIMVLPAQGVLTPGKLAEANRQGWFDSVLQLRALRPGLHQILSLTGGSGYYFAVKGTVGGEASQGFFAGVFGPRESTPHIVLAFSSPEEWPTFSRYARTILASLELKRIGP
jgi:hypothetical protein